MKNFYVLSDAVNYIESHLCEAFTQKMIADYCYVSLSGLQKLFRYAMHKSLNEYITKRRISCAAEDILNTDMTFTEIAFKYQFNSLEVFSRAFKKVWNESPSVAGDLAIVETARRIDEARTDEMLMFRIGGDEFALMTGLEDEEAVKTIMRKVTDQNEKPIVYENGSIPLSVRVALTRIPEKMVRYSELFTDMHDAIKMCREMEKIV